MAPFYLLDGMPPNKRIIELSQLDLQINFKFRSSNELFLFLFFNRFGGSDGIQSKLLMVFRGNEKHRHGTCELLFEFSSPLSKGCG